MARFTATIQLHDADRKDYDTLNAELVKESFKGNQTASPKIKEALTWKEYSREGNISLQEVSSSVSKAASKTGKRYSFTIIRNKPVYN